jgi:hypothetical protein
MSDIEHPAHGGSYIRQPDGSLQRVEGPEIAAKAQPAARKPLPPGRHDARHATKRKPAKE